MSDGVVHRHVEPVNRGSRTNPMPSSEMIGSSGLARRAMTGADRTPSSRRSIIWKTRLRSMGWCAHACRTGSRSRRLRPDPTGPQMARRCASGTQFHPELRGRLGTQPPGRGRRVRLGSDRAWYRRLRCVRRDLAAESMFEYGARVGVWRLLRLFRERGLPLTVFACARAMERNPAVVDAIVDGGYDICAHGLRWIKHRPG